MNTEKLLSSIQSVMDAAVASNTVAGVNMMVLKDGKELLSAQSGYADIEHGVPFAKDTVMRLYSMSKPVTAVAAMILMERGVIDLGEAVSTYLPGFQDQKVATQQGLVPVNRSVTIRDLLSMTSGLPYDGPTLAGQAAHAVIEEQKARLIAGNPMTTVEFANRIGELPLAFHPGEHFLYGTSADILGAVIEAASGMRFGEFLEKEIFAPLHMKDTGFYIPESGQPRRAKTYETCTGQPPLEHTTSHLAISYTMDTPPAFESGGAGLVSTLPDYARFATMLLSGGRLEDTVILRPATVDYLTNGTLLPWQQEDLWQHWDGLTGYSYGNLMRVMKHPGMSLMKTTPGEYGWDGWLGPYFSNHPTENLTFLVGMQKRDAGTIPLTRKLRNLVLFEL